MAELRDEDIAAASARAESLGQEEQAFWESREELRHVRDFARARIAPPWAVLGCVLVRVLSQVPPDYVLPGIVGTSASLNLFVAVVGELGVGGKGGAMGAARDAVGFDGDVNTWPIGTGEGIVKSFVDETSVVFEVHEMDKLAAVAGRRGTTLLSVLRSAWMGEELGFGNADLERRLKVGKHAYRAGLVADVQPARSAVLLNPDEGIPQRFLWLPGTDPKTPDVPPPSVPAIPWKLPPWPDDVPFPSGRRVLDVWPGAVAAIQEERRKRLRGEGDALDGHALLCREKVAAALGFFNGHARVTEEDWRLAGVVMRVSDRTRGIGGATRDVAAVDGGDADA